MPYTFKTLRNWQGLMNRRDPRDIGQGLAKAQNISLDIGGKIRTIGGLETHGEVPTHAAILSPGSGLFPYGSDHWRGTDTIVDLLATSGSDDNAASDEFGEANGTDGWTSVNGGTFSSQSVGAAIGGPQVGTYYLSNVTTTAQVAYIHNAFVAVVGQAYFAHAWLQIASATSDKLTFRIGTTVGGNELFESSPVSAIDTWEDFSGEFIATATTLYFSVYCDAPSNPTNFFSDGIYVTKISVRDLDTNWLALADVANAQIDLYNSRDDSFANNIGVLDFGAVALYTGVAGELDFPTTNTITDASSAFLNNNVKEGRVYKISGCSTTTANNILFAVDRVIAGTIYARENPFIVTAAEAGTVTLTEYNPTDFHFIGDSLSVSPVGGGITLRPKQYRFVNRTHFLNAESSKRQYQNWFLNDVGPVVPADIEATTGNGDAAASNLAAGTGFEIGITRSATNDDWIAGTYILAMAFRYDDGQISALYAPSTDEPFGTTIQNGDSLTLTVRAKNNYNGRISGGYIFCRIDESDEPWTLLAEISMTDGARATLSGTYNAWNESDPAGSGAANVVYTNNFKSLRLNNVSYESIAGIDPATKIETFSSDNAFWDASIIGGNRCFIFAPRYTDAGGKLQHFRDRIMYSQVNAYDIFPINNIIDVVNGDAEDYVAGGIYGNDLLAFKEKTLYIIDISDPDPVGWQMKEDKNKGKYPNRGISHPGAYFETPQGPAWINRFGAWLYNGAEIVDLLGDKIERSKHPLAYQGYYNLDGVNDVINRDAQIVSAYPFTLACRFRTASSSTGTILFVGDKSEDNVYYQFEIKSDGTPNLIARNVASRQATGSSAVNDGDWHTAVCLFINDTSRQLYIDGTSVATNAETATFAAGVDRFSVGVINRLSPAQYFDGDVTGFMIEDSQWGATEIAEYEEGNTPASVKNVFLAEDITDTTWADSVASADLTVDGATFIYPDTWEHFWTDYSILGYHGRTNQLIIMRDCTGKWSSGQDYGDAWIIDLDTLAHTTGRRIFTANVPYTNWATDWNGDLIIGRQSSSNIIIEKWTDKPQSQAARLIDIRFSDDDFGNPAINKKINEILTNYKSSTSQTNPISYRTGGSSLETNWTRLTGDFDPKKSWKELAISPTPFNAKSIQYRIDNPTNAGTMEINDFTTKKRDLRIDT